MAEGSISSSLTSTSHTLTFAPGMAPASTLRGGVDPLSFLNILSPSNRHTFLRPTPSIPAASLQFVKNTLDGFAGQISDEQQQRIKELNRKRKRSERIPLDSAEVLKVRRIHVEGFETGQVWQQAKRIIADTLKHSSEAVRELKGSRQVSVNGVTAHDAASRREEASGAEEDDASDESELEEGEGSSSEEEDAEEDQFGAFSDEENVNGLEDNDDMDVDEEADEDGEEAPAVYKDDVHGLNDGFFSIDDFNRQSQWFEDQDAKGDPYTDQASEDEDVDWNADPFSQAPKAGRPSKRDMPKDDDVGVDEDDDEGAEDEDEDEEDGPTFGDMDLFAPEGDSEGEAGEDDGGEGEDGLNANDVYYKDFFAPPARKFNGEKDKKAVRFEAPREDDENLELAMASAKRDLFDVSDDGDSDDGLSDVSAGDPKSRRSAHERRQAKIAEDIRKLEAAAVAKREWTMSGEAAAPDRPRNSLLEEALDFEFLGKPAPVITAEVSETIEDMIKRRILADEFDDVIRRRPDAASVTADTRRGLIEIEDKKSKKGLAELYEEDHLKASNPDTYMSKTDEKLRKEEKEVERMWKEVSAKLDSLSSWHYKPKPVEPSLTIVADVATVTMEDAQPTTAQGVSGGQSMIAPQEVYKASKDTARDGEVVAKSGLPVARQEMTREDKRRRRRRDKERQRKASGQAGNELSKKAQMQKDTLADLKKGGVKVINRKGEVLDVDGKKSKTAKPVSSEGYKL